MTHVTSHYRKPHIVRGHFRRGVWISQHKRDGSIVREHWRRT